MKLFQNFLKNIFLIFTKVINVYNGIMILKNKYALQFKSFFIYNTNTHLLIMIDCKKFYNINRNK